MPKKLLVLLTIFFLFPIISNAQIDICGTPDNPLTQKTKDLINQSKMMQVEFCVNIRFHILQNSSGDSAVPDSHINLILNDLNLAFNQHQIFFNNVGINHIQNDTYYNIDDNGNDEGVTEFNGLISLNDNDPNAINLYIVNDAESFGGRAQRPGNSTVIASSSVLSTTNAHEIGHNFGLLHTHSTASGTENIERSGSNANCNQAGDGFCSTPADPNLLNQIVDPPVYKVDTSCNYTATETRNGLPYDPDTSNFMSYSRRYCRDSFTQEQGDFMNVMIQTESVLQQTVSSICTIPEVVGSDFICIGSNYTYTLQNPPSTYNWSISNNMDIVSFTSSAITVKAKYSTSQGNGFITATYNNGAEATKEVYVGKPYANLPQAPNLCTNSFSDPYTLPASDGATSYRLESGSPYLQINGQSEVTFTNAPVPLIYFSSSSPGTYLVQLFTSNPCGGESRGAMYVTSETCGLGGPGGFNVYPNPASNEVTIEANPEKSNSTYETQSLVIAPSTQLAKLYDFNGAFVKDIELDPYGTTKLDVSNLKDGMYFLKIQGRQEEETYKIIVRH